MGTEEIEEADPWETYSRSKDSAEGGEGEDKEEAEQDFHEVAGGKDAPGTGTVDLGRISKSISNMALFVTLLQFQEDTEQRLPPRCTSPTAPL